MRRILFLLLLFAGYQSFGQNYYDFAPVGAKWTFNRYTNLSTSPNDYRMRIDYVENQVISDTLIDGKNCRAITNVDYNGKKIYFHSDSGKVSYYIKGRGFCPLYDFNLNAGDTMTTTPLFFYPYTATPPLLKFIIDSVAYYPASPRSLKILYIDRCLDGEFYFYDGKIIEKIGTNFIFPINIIVYGLVYTLRCYEDSEIGLHFFPKNDYYNLVKNCTDTVLIIRTGTENNTSLPTVKLYPNPVFDRFFIQSDQSISAIQLYTLLGQKIPIQLTDNKGIYEIDMNNVPNGLYILEYQINQQLFWQKIRKE